MTYDSVDKLQNHLANKVFGHTKDAKKAAGRGLGTLVELIAFYLLKAWGLEQSLCIETRLPEYGNKVVTHNVEYTLHPVLDETEAVLDDLSRAITAGKILSKIDSSKFTLDGITKKNNTLLSSKKTIRNACKIGDSEACSLVATVLSHSGSELRVLVSKLFVNPYAMFECKRVGVEEGTKKGPQTIEKAKQGAYVANSVSSVQKLRKITGELQGLVWKSGEQSYIKPYSELLEEVVESNDPQLLQDFVLTIGLISNHGNWFTSGDPNKEMRVLAGAYDWLIFLSDSGLSEFISDVLLKPLPGLEPAGTAFRASYLSNKKSNQFTKVHIDLEADKVLSDYFANHLNKIEGWFNVISPKEASLNNLQSQLSTLKKKNWRMINGL
jgi:hypothetical protein